LNVLISCAGRRSYLVDWFRAAIAPDGKVVATNSERRSTALAVADVAVVAPPLAEPSYVDFLLEVCRRESIELVVPVFDLELPLLAAAVDRFTDAGITVAVSTPDVVAACQDKLRTGAVAEGAGLRAPRTTVDPVEAAGWLRSGLRRVFVKPRLGTGSILTWSTDDPDEVGWLHRKVRRQLASTYVRDVADGVIVQEGLGGTEHGLTIVNDLQGRFRAVLANRKWAMRAGETDVAEAVGDDRLVAAGRALARHLGHVGALDVDVFVDESVDGGQVSVLDLNPRLGGNYPFSHIAGADVPSAYVRWVRGQPVDDALFAVTPGVVGLKAIDLVRLP
jgi:carbamoyl-phosphate synthase large subunit